MIRVAVPGAAGKMGQMVLQALQERSDMRPSAAVERAGHPKLGQELLPSVRLTSDLATALAQADVYVDFTVPDATVQAVSLAAELGVAAVVGTTGLSPTERGALERAASRIPIVFSPNFSLGVNLLLGLAEQAARALGDDFDLEIVELHHRAKRDAPSGTAIALADALARGRGLSLDKVKRFSREGDVGARSQDELGVFAVRGGDVVGEHTAFFLGNGERVELTHRATTRMIFARGAARAAAWVVGKPPRLYSMADVLGFS
ncbi:MAG: 4-hydroxy-tetrahydrodipicolinate reductase [Deltaproteobacteria bacterium]|nr:4-hydroxy-tetrahydrodipicolinate reductase [Deltaproteobacteria bacterium]